MGCIQSTPVQADSGPMDKQSAGGPYSAVGEDAVLKETAMVPAPTTSGRILITRSVGGSGKRELEASSSVQEYDEDAQAKMLLEADTDEARQKLQELQLGMKMGLEIYGSESPPFIGLLNVEVLQLKTQRGNYRRPQVCMLFDGDRSRYIMAANAAEAREDDKELDDREEDGDTADYAGQDSFNEGNHGSAADALVTTQSGISSASAGGGGSVFQWEPGNSTTFVAVFSSSRLSFRVRERTSVGLPDVLIGEGTVLLPSIREGTEQLEVELTRSSSSSHASRPVAILVVNVTYSYLRGTRDQGRYYGPSRVFVDQRKARRTSLLAKSVSLEGVSEVNHWVCSHDNVWVPDSRRRLSEGIMHQLSNRKSATSSLGDSAGGEDPERHGSSSLASTPTHMAQAMALEQRLAAVAGINGSGGTDTVMHVTPGQGVSVAAEEGASDGRSLRVGAYSPQQQLQAAALLDAFGKHKDDSADTAQLRQQCLAVTSMLADRVNELEVQLAFAVEAIQQLHLDADQLYDNSTHAKTNRPYISGHFEYGIGRPAKNREVLLFLASDHTIQDSAGGPTNAMFMGRYTTDQRGNLPFVHLPKSLSAVYGHYNVTALLPEDNTFGKGSLYILQPGTKCVVFDLDGTITIGDSQVVAQFGLGTLGGSLSSLQFLARDFDLRARDHALTCVRLWAAKGYQPIYLSGRQGSFYNLTLEWLMKHGYPPGPIHLTRTHLPTLPVYMSVGNFKVKYMEGLKKKGLEIYAAYGNTGTDVKAYEVVGIPKERTFMLGQAAGARGTVNVRNFSDNIKHVLTLPDASPSIPYTELLYGDRPDYKNRRRRESVYTPGPVTGTGGLPPIEPVESKHLAHMPSDLPIVQEGASFREHPTPGGHGNRT